MTISYRTPGAWGAGLSRDLHPGEVDQNFYELKGTIDGILADLPGATVSILSMSQVGDDLYVTLTDDSILGPFKLPVVKMVFRDEWQPDTTYYVSDVVTMNGAVYLVNISHTSNPTFDPGANDGIGHDYYGLMLTYPGDVLPAGGDTGQVLTKISEDDFDAQWLTSGVPAGGDTGQVLTKLSGDDYDTAWAASGAEAVTGLPAGGAADAMLIKLSSTDYDVDWIVRGRTIPITGLTHVLALTDAYGWLRCTNSSGCVVTIPDNATVAFGADTEITIRAATDGAVTISAAAGVTLNVPTGFTNVLLAKGATALVKKVDTNVWDLAGLLTPG